MTEPTDEPVNESVDESPEGARSGILGSSAVMAAGTVVSRLSGFARTGLLIAALGNGLRGDVFNVASPASPSELSTDPCSVAEAVVESPSVFTSFSVTLLPHLQSKPRRNSQRS